MMTEDTTEMSTDTTEISTLMVCCVLFACVAKELYSILAFLN